MKTVSMSGSLRENVGKKDAKALRRQDLVPCVVYGGEEQIQFSVEQKDFKPLLFTPETHYINLNINGKEIRAILQDIQYHPVSDEVLHADFLRIYDDKPITTLIPVNPIGVAPGVLQGGKLVTKLRKLRIKGLPDNIPQHIDIDISKLEIGNSIRVEKLELENVECLENKSSIVLWVKPTRQSSKG